MHEDSEGSSKFIFDPMEPEVRKVDRTVLDFVKATVLIRGFHDPKPGVCRLISEMARMVVATTSTARI